LYAASAESGGFVDIPNMDQSPSPPPRRRRPPATSLRRALRAAIDDGELRLHFQPQVELATGTVVGVEALVRWEHPTLGLLEPATFLPMAERSELIFPLGAWVLEEACREAARWRAHRPERPVSVAVNVSGRQIADPSLVDVVAGALDATGLEPARLRLELSERDAVEHAEATVESVRELRRLGVGSSIDDFGTGHSPLRLLREVPVDELKIDQAFVGGLGERPDDSIVVAAMIGLAHGLGLTTLAKGVERPAQAVEVARLGCPVGQGFLWSGARPAREIDPLLDQRLWTVSSPPAADGDGATHIDPDAALALVVHELRTPLSVIRGYNEMLSDLRLLPAARQAIERSTRRIERILDGVSDLTALDQGGLRPRLAAHKVADVLRGLVDELRVVHGAERLSLELDRASTDLVAHFDQSRIEQVVVNLITNALRYGPPGGEVRVVVGATPTTWTCAVIDEGVGVPLELAGTIFRKYARASSRVAGSGIGLYLARGIARAHGGDLTYRRTPEQTSEFLLRLPRDGRG
jgi:EAL domain-containing protein (putative c-di-GMP-specific phosphodiesterase class I)/two-component sensor histidine kinase